MTAEETEDRSVTVISAEGKEIGTVSLGRYENWVFIRKRLYDLISTLYGLEETMFREYRQLEFADRREQRITGYDETCLQGLRTVFPQSNVDGLFTEHRPTEVINGRAYFLWVVEAILKGFNALIGSQKAHTWAQVQM